MERLKHWLGQPPLAPFAIPIFAAMPLWQSNYLRLPYGDIMPAMGALLLIVGAFMALIYLVQRSWQRAALIAMMWTAYLLYVPSLAYTVASKAWIWPCIALCALLVWDLSRRVPRTQPELARANLIANVMLVPTALALSIAVMLQIISLEEGRPTPQQVFAPFPGKATAQSPDVWHIVMDRYASTETLSRIYGYNNRPFLEALRRRGFAVNEQAHSNYQITAHSLASAMNADYLDGLARKTAREDDMVPLFGAVRQSEALRFFNQQGYETFFAGTWANISVTSAIADHNVNFRDLSEAPRMLISQSLPGLIGTKFNVPYAASRNDQCVREKVKFAKLHAIAGQAERKYVFAHFLLPHPPFTLQADGSCNPVANEWKKSRAANYNGQLDYANRELLALIDAILAGSRPATIVLHADEGPYPIEYAGDELFNKRLSPDKPDWTKVASEKLREKTGILMAIRHADGKTADAPGTPINIYPLILNRSFGAHMPLRPERTLIFPNNQQLYSFTDRTDELS